mgnify:CR=1 FL=1|jgi:aspartyl/asparaginyl-tRNA synthetase
MSNKSNLKYPTENWIHGWLKSIWRKKSDKLDMANDAVENLHIENMRLNERIDSLEEKEYPYNIEFGDGRTKEEMDKMQKELMECGCLPDCGCKE